jgi:hypothetical protein
MAISPAPSAAAWLMLKRLFRAVTVALLETKYIMLPKTARHITRNISVIIKAKPDLVFRTGMN